jgi:hypothetical protein
MAFRNGPRPTTASGPTDTATFHGGTSRLGDVTSGEAGTDLQATWDRPHLYEKLAEGFGTVKRLKK